MMRDTLSDLHAGEPVNDPVKTAQRLMKTQLPKRFYKTAEAVETDGGFAVHLDGRTARTTGKNRLILPSFDLARLIAAEWAAQGDHIDPVTMPLTRIAFPAIDSVSGKMSEVRADIASYAGSDLTCYRAAEPEALVARQSAAWNPVVRRVEAETGGRFVLAEGVMHQAQPEATLIRFAAALDHATPDAFTLSAAHVMTSLTGSALIALCVTAGWLAADAAWAAAHVDEDWTNDHWGVDAEAKARRAARWHEFAAAAAVVQALR
jgi:chaperone required for assembly of F1-ATPase